MFRLNVFILLIFLITNITALRRDSDVYFEDATPKLKQSSSSMLSDIAHELIRRSSNSSQVLNLNLSNLLLLLVLKAVVYGAGYIGNHAFRRRGDIDEESILSEGETALALGYIIGDTCLYKAACEVPHTAKEYLGAAEMIYRAVKFMPKFVDVDESYEIKMVEFQKAIDLGLKGQCPSDYKCERDNIQRF